MDLSALTRLPRQLQAIARHPLNRGETVTALMRWLNWQCVSRLSPGPIAVPFIGGTSLMCRPGETGVTGNVYYGLAEYVEMTFALRLLKAGDLFVDVGANAGSYTVLAAGACGANVIALEPDKYAFSRLTLNVRLNNLSDRVEAHQAAAGDRNGSIDFLTGADTGNRVSIDGGRASPDIVTVPCVTLDTVVGDRQPTMLKIDVEGFEAAVLAGAGAILQCASLLALIVETNGSDAVYGHTPGSLVDNLAGAGFSAASYNPDTNTIEPYASRRLPVEGNTIFVRMGSDVAERLTSSPFARDLRLRQPLAPGF